MIGPEDARAAREHSTGYLGLGSNVGNRLANLRAARDALEERGVSVTAASSVYETEPVGDLTAQRDFLNACLAVATTLPPERLLEVCKAVERSLGRVGGGPRHGPRPIDVDLLMLGGLELRSAGLELPHPEITRRRFVLEPLLELEPGLQLPDGSALAGFAEGVRDQRAERVGPL